MEIKPIPIALLILLAFMAAVLFLAFKLSRQYVLPLVKKRKSYRLFDIWLFRGELLAWALFLIFTAYRTFIISPYMSLFIISLILLAGRAFWKDFMPGLLFRLENNALIGDSMLHGGSNCIIACIGPRNLHLRSKEGETIILPYSHIGEAVISKSVQKSKLHQFTFTVTSENKNPTAASTLFGKYIQECPWSIPARQPIIHFLENGQFEITSFAIDKNSAEKQRQYVAGRVKAAEA